MLKGIDVSHFQAPTAVPWHELGQAGAFAIVRMSYGTKRDQLAAEHVRRARAAGVTVGAYHFFRPGQPLADQLEVFDAACQAATYGEAQDIVPALDFEDDTTAFPIGPEHAPLAQKMLILLEGAFDCRPLLYITQRDWGRVGSPAWALEYPLWVAHYSQPSRLEPATPAGKPWAIWQHRVGPLDLNGPHGAYQPQSYDQNLANYLPLIDGSRLGPNPAPEEQILPEPPDAHRTEALRATRLADLAAQAIEDNFRDDNAELTEALT